MLANKHSLEAPRVKVWKSRSFIIVTTYSHFTCAEAKVIKSIKFFGDRKKYNLDKERVVALA